MPHVCFEIFDINSLNTEGQISDLPLSTSLFCQFSKKSSRLITIPNFLSFAHMIHNNVILNKFQTELENVYSFFCNKASKKRRKSRSEKNWVDHFDPMLMALNSIIYALWKQISNQFNKTHQENFWTFDDHINNWKNDGGMIKYHRFHHQSFQSSSRHVCCFGGDTKLCNHVTKINSLYSDVRLFAKEIDYIVTFILSAQTMSRVT